MSSQCDFFKIKGIRILLRHQYFAFFWVFFIFSSAKVKEYNHLFPLALFYYRYVSTHFLPRTWQSLSFRFTFVKHRVKFSKLLTNCCSSQSEGGLVI